MFPRKAVIGISLFGVFTSLGVAFSDPVYASSYTMKKSSIVLNGKSISTPYKFVAGVPATTYMPIYYVQQLVDKILLTSVDKWEGSNYSWHIDTATATGFGSQDHADGTPNDAVVIINGVIAAKRVPFLRTVDPYSGKLTTFMPIWYVQQIVNKLFRLNKQTDSWNGSSWNLSIQQLPH